LNENNNIKNGIVIRRRKNGIFQFCCTIKEHTDAEMEIPDSKKRFIRYTPGDAIKRINGNFYAGSNKDALAFSVIFFFAVTVLN
jgi:hypothetical protein